MVSMRTMIKVIRKKLTLANQTLVGGLFRLTSKKRVCFFGKDILHKGFIPKEVQLIGFQAFAAGQRTVLKYGSTKTNSHSKLY